MTARKYGHSRNIMISQDVADLVDHLAERENLSKAQVLRAFIHAGIRTAGYEDVLTTSLGANPVAALKPED